MAKTFRFYVILILSNLIMSQAIMGADHLGLEQTYRDNEELDRELLMRGKFIGLMLQVGEELDHSIGNESNGAEDSLKIVTLLEEKMQIYERFYELSLEIPINKRAAFKKYFLSLNWKKVLVMFKKAHIGVEVFFKRKGFGLGIAILAGMLCEYTVPAILVHLGMGHLIPFSMMTPWSTIYSFIPSVIQKMKVRRMLTEALGSSVQVEAYLKQQENFLKVFHMQSPEDLIFPLSNLDGGNKSVVIHKNGIKSNLLGFLGVDQKALNYTTIKKFVSENNLSDPYIEWILQNNAIDNDLKVGFISSHILSLNDPSVTQKFEEEFSANILLLKGHDDWQAAWEWTLEMLKVKDLNELLKKTSEAPLSMDPKSVVLVWENILLPEYALKLDLNYSEARRMYNEFEVVKAKMIMSDKSQFDELVKNEMYTYIKKITAGNKFKGCQNTPFQINNYLLGKLNYL